MAPPSVNGAVVFCHVVSAVARGFPLGSMALCVARTFLMRAFLGGNHARDGLSGCCFVAQIYVKSINFGGKYVSLFKLTALLYDDNKHVHA
mgnify:CR=1 FL=1